MENKYPNDIKNDEQLYEPDLRAPIWHTGQCYEPDPAVQIKCSRCGSDKFHVAQSDFWTGIKCPNCGYETVIHSG